MEKLYAIVERITFVNEENGFCVLKVNPQDKIRTMDGAASRGRAASRDRANPRDRAASRDSAESSFDRVKLDGGI